MQPDTGSLQKFGKSEGGPEVRPYLSIQFYCIVFERHPIPSWPWLIMLPHNCWVFNFPELVWRDKHIIYRFCQDNRWQAQRCSIRILGKFKRFTWLYVYVWYFVFSAQLENHLLNSCAVEGFFFLTFFFLSFLGTFSFWSHLCILHGGLLGVTRGVTFCLSVVCLGLYQRLNNNSYLRKF